jgi:rubredoxin
MKILKHGNLKERKFVCRVCGCEFVATNGEYDVTMAGGQILWHSSYCPDCGCESSMSEPWEEKDD